MLRYIQVLGLSFVSMAGGLKVLAPPSRHSPPGDCDKTWRNDEVEPLPSVACSEQLPMTCDG